MLTKQANQLTKFAKNLKNEGFNNAHEYTPIQLSSMKPRADEYIQYNHKSNKKIYYRLGIIDFLQKYNKKKQIETKWL